MTQNKLIAVAGGIASGKSAVMECLKNLGANVLSCDEINRELLLDKDYIARLGKEFGVVKGGALDKAMLREMILNDSKVKKRLESIAHPIIKAEILRRARLCDGNVFVEVPLLKGAGLEGMFDVLWYVKAPNELRIVRTMARDGVSREVAEKFLRLQSIENELEKSADCIILNDSTYNKLCERIIHCYNEI